MTRTVGLLGGAAVLSAAAGMRMRAYFCNRSSGARDLATGLAALAAAMTIYAPPVYVWLDRVVFRQPNVSELAGHLAIVTSAWAAVAMVSGLVREDLTVRRLVGLCALATSAAMATVFLRQNFPIETSSFTTVYGNTDAVRLYWAIFLAYAIAVLCALCILTSRAPIEDQPWLRRGLRLVAIGSGLGAIYMLHWAIELAAMAHGRTTPQWFGDASHGAGVMSAALIAAGTSLPTLGPRARAALAVRRLRPLWADVTSRYPEVRIPSERGDDRLLRMVVEIRDAATEARVRGVLDNDMLLALDRLAPRNLLEFDEEIRQLEALARRRFRSKTRKEKA